MIGKTISQYKIIEKIGEGGMGVVYKAEDTKLDRNVALKFLPQHLTTTDMERARFLQEAKAAAALNHPNVCVIHEIHDKGDQPFIVMEYVQGQTIREIVTESDKRLTVDNALKYAIQMAEALQEAHSKGIVHRDVKSENIMVNSKNQIKVMDFGLAKLKGALKLTKSASTVGTLSYMAPEQIEGHAVDARSDIFSFGVVLYEMLTGQLPFSGDYEAALMYSVLNEEPEALQKHLPEASSELVHIINRALEKEPEERYQNLGDMLIDLRRAKKETGKVSRKSVAEMPSSQPASTSQGGPTRKISPRMLGIGLGAVAILILALFFFRQEGSPELNPNMTFRVLPTPYPQINYPSLSQDGNWVAFPSADASGMWGVYFMNSAGGDPRRIASHSTEISSVDISPDGSQVGYTRWFRPGSPAKFFVVSSLGGHSTQIVEKGVYPQWRPDGQRIGYVVFAGGSQSGKREFWSVRPDGSDNRLEYIDSERPNRVGRISFSWSPDGQCIAWLRTFAEGHVEVLIVDLGSGEERQLTFDKKIIDEVKWTHQDDIIFSSTRSGNTNLWKIPAQGGKAVQITKGSGPDIGMGISADGKKLLYLQQQELGNIWLASGDGSSSRQLTFEDQRLGWPALSPDAKQIVYVMGDTDPAKVQAVGNVYVMDRAGHNRRPLTSENETVKYPQWSPDGKWIVYQVGYDENRASVYVIPSRASGRITPKLIAKGGFPRWFDPQTISFWWQRTRFRVALQGGEPSPVYQDSTNAVPVMGGEYLLFWDNHKGREGVYVISMADVHAKRSGRAKKIGEFDVTSWSLSPSGRFFMEYRAPGEIWKVSLPDGERERLGGAFTNPHIEPGSISFTYDQQEAVYATKRISAKLVLIEDFVK